VTIDYIAFINGLIVNYPLDAHFAMTVTGPIISTSSSSSSQSPSSSSQQQQQQLQQVYMCVADGVGSWRQYGVDPRLFAHKLVENARKTVQMDAEHRLSLAQYPVDTRTIVWGDSGTSQCYITNTQ
jgi:hypothetical protein